VRKDLGLPHSTASGYRFQASGFRALCTKTG
jgi:hypothetical protein